MKIVVNKDATIQRAKGIVDRIKLKAIEVGDNGKESFLVSLESDELNGVNIDELKKMIEVEYEGTIKFTSNLSNGDSYMHLKIVEPW